MGIHFVNNTSDYYEFFSTPTNYSDSSVSIKSTTVLQGGVVFTNTTESTSIDVIFNLITGETTPATVSVSSENETRMVTVTALGTVY